MRTADTLPSMPTPTAPAAPIDLVDDTVDHVLRYLADRDYPLPRRHAMAVAIAALDADRTRLRNALARARDWLNTSPHSVTDANCPVCHCVRIIDQELAR